MILIGAAAGAFFDKKKKRKTALLFNWGSTSKPRPWFDNSLRQQTGNTGVTGEGPRLKQPIKSIELNCHTGNALRFVSVKHRVNKKRLAGV